MDSRHIELYDEELHFIREMGKIFAQNNPRVAGYLDLASNECQDPYVERLLEGFAFLTSRIQLQYQEEFPEFSQHLIDIIYPDFLAPQPSTTIIQLSPSEDGDVSTESTLIARHEELYSIRVSPKKTKCTYRTTRDTRIWPIKVAHAHYHLPEEIHVDVKNNIHPDVYRNARGFIKITLDTFGEDEKKAHFNTFNHLEKLTFYLSGTGSLTGKLYETLFANLNQIVIHSPKTKDCHILPKESLQQSGFEKDQALLPNTHQGFQGFRILQEYFIQPKKFLFITLNNLVDTLNDINSPTVDLYFILNKRDDDLLQTLETDNFQLFCTPAINLFPQKADRVHLTKKSTTKNHSRKNNEVSHYLPGYPVIVEKSNTTGYEIYKILEVKGIGSRRQDSNIFSPLYSLNHSALNKDALNFYTLKRKAETVTNRKKISHYQGNDIYISLSDNESHLPYSKKIKELAIETLSTNRGIPLYLGSNRISFTSPKGIAGIKEGGIKNIEEFTPPKPAHAASQHTWRLISLLSLNHLSLASEDPEQSTIAMRELLELQIHSQKHGVVNNKHNYENQINKGLQKVESKKITHPIYIEGKMTYARGTQITVTLDENAFEGGSAFLFGSILDRFFSQYSSINSFTQTIVKTIERGEIMKWPVRMGNKIII